MASVECGHVYVVLTTLTKPEPKEKIVLCICEKSNLFVWFNTEAQRHGAGQLKCAAGITRLLRANATSIFRA